MHKRTLGQTNIEVTPIGLGVMEMSHGGGLFGRLFPYIAPEEKNAIIQAALDGGINWFDTAELYGKGVSEQALATGLQATGKTDEDVVVATKWFPLLRTAGNIPRTIDDRLRYLSPYTIDNYMVHNPMGFSSPEAEMNALADLIDAGKIRSAGVSNFDANQMRRAQTTLQARGYSLAVNQMPYSLLNRKIETSGVLDTARELGVTIVAYWPLESGLLTGKYHQNPVLVDQKSVLSRRRLKSKMTAAGPLVEAMTGMAESHEVTVAQVALNWVIYSQGDTVVAIPGATKSHQAAQNAAAMYFRLTDDEMGRLDELSLAAAG